MAELLKTFHFPKAGLDVSLGTHRQPNREVQQGLYSRTSASAVNVRGWDSEGELRGASRSGLSRHFDKPYSFVWPQQELETIVTVSENPVQTSQSGRVVWLVSVSQGNVFYVAGGDDEWTQATNSTQYLRPLITAGQVFSTSLNQIMYFADGERWVKFNPKTGICTDWTATAGSLPEDSDGNTPRLICTWRGRIVLSGLLQDPHNWFMSAQDNASDFDYSPLSQTPTQAVAGNNSPLGLIGDVCTALVPFTDDLLVFGGDHTIYAMKGDPMNGGTIDQVSNTIGFAWGKAWCMDPNGILYFFSNRMGVYQMVPGQMPQRMSQPVDRRLRDVDSGESIIRMMWSDEEQGFYLFITPTDKSATTHWFWEQRTGAWWPVEFANLNHNPLCCCIYDGNLPTDRAALLGGWHGYVLKLDRDAEDDDGTPISSEVVIGPFLTDNLDALLMKDIQPVLAEGSGDVDYEILVGATAEEALASEPAASGTWTAGRGPTEPVRASGHALYVRLSSTDKWAMEAIRIRLAGQGKVQRRKA